MAARRSLRLSAVSRGLVLLLACAPSCTDPAPPAPAPAPVRKAVSRPRALRTELTIRSVDALLTSTAAFQRNAGIAPAHRVDSEQLRSSLFDDLGLPGLPGAANLAQPARLLILDPTGTGQRALLVIAVKDRAALLQGTQRLPPAPGNQLALSPSTGKAPVQVNYIGEDRVALSRSGDAYPRLRDTLAGKDREATERADAELRVHGSAPYEPITESLQRRITDALARWRAQGLPDTTARRVTRAGESLAAALMQIDHTHARIALDEQALSATVSFRASPGSRLARFLEDQPRGQLPLAGLVPADALLSASGRTRLGDLLPLCKDLLAELFAFSPKRRSEARAQLETVARRLDGRIAVALTTDDRRRLGLTIRLGSDRPDRVRASLLGLLRGYTHTPLHAELVRRGLTPPLTIDERHAPGIDRIGPWPTIGDLSLSTSADALIIGLGTRGERSKGSGTISIGLGFDGNRGWIRLTAPARAIANLMSALGYQARAN